MKRIEEVYREILFQSMEKKNCNLTQSYLADALNMSLSVVNIALEPLKRMVCQGFLESNEGKNKWITIIMY